MMRVRKRTNRRLYCALAVAIFSFFMVAAEAIHAQEGPVKIVVPAFPRILLHLPASGAVTIEMKIDKTGAVMDAVLKEGSKFFFPMVRRAALKWKFPEVKTRGERHFVATFTFTILPSDANPEEATVIFTQPNLIEIRAIRPEIDPTPIN
ncbi:MAG: hypothetical protein JFAIHJKO_02118 [Pyrinomonadaceae bacterium]|nr:hypothetical protein [Pyrinomonadaceae bacterium]